MRVVNGVTITTVVSIKIANEKAGQSWFSADNMRYWGTRVNNKVYGGRYFVTSDYTFDNNRAYSIRELKDNGHIETVVFQRYTTRSEAHKAAKLIAGLSE